MRAIKFGTDGWRGIIAEDFTFANVRIVAQAVANYLRGSGRDEQGVLVGYDTRFLSREFAQACAEVLAANEIFVLLPEREIPSPVAAFTVQKRKLGGAILVTASHNPPQYNGVKFRTWYGGAASEEITNQIEVEANRLLGEGEESPIMPLQEAVEKGVASYFEPAADYFEQLTKLVDMVSIRRAPPSVVVDPMHGASRGYLGRMLYRVGCRVRVIRSTLNPLFGGVKPEPLAENLPLLIGTVRHRAADLGVATDGDGDRLALIDSEGTYINPHQIFALLLIHLVEDRGWRGEVARTVSTTSMVDKLGREYGLEVYETPVGFKHICPLMLEGDILIAGEESGGIGFKEHIPERDGILAALLLVEMMAQREKGVGELVAELWQKVGRHYYDRLDISLPEGEAPDLERLSASPPQKLVGKRLAEINTKDGLKFLLEDGSWLLVRVSRTEPLVRVYAESYSRRELTALIEYGRRLVISAGAGL